MLGLSKHDKQNSRYFHGYLFLNETLQHNLMGKNPAPK